VSVCERDRHSDRASVCERKGTFSSLESRVLD